jgi:hypothetical protein
MIALALWIAGGVVAAALLVGRVIRAGAVDPVHEGTPP